MFKLLVTLVMATSLSTSMYAQTEAPTETPTPQETPKNPREKSPEKKTAEVGEQAPEFELVDQNGNTHSLEEYKGKIVVLEWFREKCPYCKHTWESGLIPKLIRDLKDMDSEVVYLAVNSTANAPKEEVIERGKEFLEELEVDVPILSDYSGQVGREYGARTTPHLFVIDAEGILVYQGALSDDKRGDEGSKAETHILRVVTQLEAGEEVSPSYVQPWGCGVKYANDGGRDGRGKGGRRPRGGSGQR